MPRPSIAEERREEIFEAFEACALRKGLEATTLADVAAAAGLPRPLVRHFVGNREAMEVGLIERMVQRATAALQQAIGSADAERDGELLQIVLTGTFTDQTTNRLMIQLWQRSWQDPELHSRLTAVYGQCVEQVHAQLFAEPSPETYDRAYALTALALGYGVFNEFKLRPRNADGLVQAARALTQPI
ncbi:MAG: hypothetical protein AAGG11_18995 [Pseudomonadota bacterium]